MIFVCIILIGIGEDSSFGFLKNKLPDTLILVPSDLKGITSCLNIAWKNPHFSYFWYITKRVYIPLWKSWFS